MYFDSFAPVSPGESLEKPGIQLVLAKRRIHIKGFPAFSLLPEARSSDGFYKRELGQ